VEGGRSRPDGPVCAPFFGEVHGVGTVDGGRILSNYRKNKVIFTLGDPADAVFYIQEGQVEITVVSEQGKEAVVAVLGPDEILRRGMSDGTAAAHGYSQGNDRV
jgi:CRP/FNR family transcriptional regulator, cyclic AMP receptor protein